MLTQKRFALHGGEVDRVELAVESTLTGTAGALARIAGRAYGLGSKVQS